MVPPELGELTSCLYSFNSSNASEERVNEGERAIPTALKQIQSPVLLDEEGFAELIAANKRFHGPEAGEEVLDLPVLIHLLRRADDRRRNHLQRIRIRHSIALKALRLLAVEHRQNHPAGPQQFRQTGNHLLRKHWLKVVQQVP